MTELSRIRDQRRANARYVLTELLGNAFARASVECPSLLNFDERTKAGNRNLKNIYRLAAIPSDSQMRAALASVEPAPLRQDFRELFAVLSCSPPT